ncbi:E3 ubiquitin-protein ligase RGLG3-like [Magnolia sinica]|uniref:E3 ubiquitin-protein ligase RGLG3-like n=1 Tax=Magnolia sinica TaxID=86752 RepID=UPI002658BD04|nr:E3 ubiquitin-protein ligase RGLG3-like [Magnolia sinica]
MEGYHHSYKNRTSSSWGNSPSPSDVIHRKENEVVSRLRGKYSRIANNYESLNQVQAALVQAGLESSNLIVGIDFTKSNEWTGQNSFNGRSLHHISDSQNPYERAISIIGRTLSGLDEDDLVPCFGFGDASTHDQEVFSFFQDGRPCKSFQEALCRYKEIVPHLKLSGPTSFAPIIETAIGIVEKNKGRYHVLLIIADGQVTQNMDTHHGDVSPQEKDTIDAIVKASNYPLSIILVGVGDGPWDMMRQFDDNIPARAFDNFQFVNFTEIMAQNIPLCKKETEFALAALMEIPSQYKATIELHLLGCTRGTPVRAPLPPPPEISRLDNQIYQASQVDMSSMNRNQESSPSKSTRKSPAKLSVKFGSENSSQSRIIHWTDEMDNRLIDILMEQVTFGRNGENGFQRETYKLVVADIKNNVGISLTSTDVQNHIRTLKSIYFTVRDMLNASGFGWDSKMKTVIAPNEVWVEYIKSHPYADYIQGKSIPRYDDLAYIIRNGQASGRSVTTSNILPGVGSRRTRDPEDSITNTLKVNKNNLILSSNDGVNASYQSPSGDGNNSGNTGSTISSRKRMRIDHPCDRNSSA